MVDADDATRVLYRFDGVEFGEDIRWFVPEVGLVRVEVDLPGAGRTTYVLRNKRRLGGSCPTTDLGSSVGDVCSTGLNL